jgi:hypothetical protein
MTRRAWTALAIVVVPLLAYPLVALVHGGPRFPTRADCVHPAVDGHPAAVVFGRLDDPVIADQLRDRALTVGFKEVEAVPDGCGRWKVLLDDVPDLTVARGVQAEARKVGLRTTLELGSAG